jgi:hypothetical protein
MLHYATRLCLAAVLTAFIALPAHASCGSAFCSLSTDLGTDATGVVEGSLFDLRYENIDQSQPRAGSRKVQVGEIPHDHDEVSTKHQNLIATYTRTFGSGWGFSVAAPFVDRRHTHIANDEGAPFPERWNFREPGDLRVTGRYQAVLPGKDDTFPAGGLIFGFKLPTGRTNVANASGEVAERSLQPGSGTTDAILGAFFQQQIPHGDAAWFAHAQYQRALNSHKDFKPGSQFAADLGYAKVLGDKLSGNLQLNAVVKGRDSGAAAEPENSGGRFLFLSPGVSYQVSGAVRAYAFYQQPLYQYVNGVQLTATRAFVLGLSTRF